MQIQEIKIVGFQKDGYLMLYINGKEFKKKKSIYVIHSSNVYKAINNHFNTIKYVSDKPYIFMVDINKPYMHIDEFLKAPLGHTPIDITGIELTDMNIMFEYDTGILNSFVKKCDVLKNKFELTRNIILIDNIISSRNIYSFFIKACQLELDKEMRLVNFKTIDILNPEFALLNKDNETHIVVDISEHCNIDSIALAVPVTLIKEFDLTNITDLFDKCSIHLCTDFNKFMTSSKYREKIVGLKYEDDLYFVLLNQNYDKIDAILLHDTNRSKVILQKLASLRSSKKIQVINFILK